ncbi:hypothetical protein NL676_008651 [Syzygium grande]|nr:hypothetical protein NL676_008651 [Syzygium grande]
MLVVRLVVTMETHNALTLWPPQLDPKKAAVGVKGASLKWCLRKGETISRLRVSKLLEQVVVVVAGFGVGLGIPRVGLGELGVDEARTIKIHG